MGPRRDEWAGRGRHVGGTPTPPIRASSTTTRADPLGEPIPGGGEPRQAGPHDDDLDSLYGGCTPRYDARRE